VANGVASPTSLKKHSQIPHPYSAQGLGEGRDLVPKTFEKSGNYFVTSFILQLVQENIIWAGTRDPTWGEYEDFGRKTLRLETIVLVLIVPRHIAGVEVCPMIVEEI
jgi:hypothetical protein